MPPLKPKRFAVFIRDQRIAAGLSATQLAERVEVNRSYISMLEHGERTNPSTDFIKRLALVLKVPVEEFYAHLGVVTSRAPELPVYLRTKYGLPSHAIEEITQHIAKVRRQYQATKQKGGRGGKGTR